ncbi:MAG: MiaB/RimO family radical SAM methylthiotransferase [Candidatus Eremiobacteraeota bacterium]|nr:MiaB/RimO family radical SAM methylthiotransferase [Candidatus Eremiobacteraeota bacterium]
MANIYIETFGCQMNQADSRYIADRAASAGYTVVRDPEEADVLILNTCTVRDNAERRAYGRLHQFKALKRSDPQRKLVVTGCLAEQDRERIQRVVPHVDAVFGTKELVALGDRLVIWRPDFEDTEATEERSLLVPIGGADCVEGAFSHLRGFVTVQRGCSYYCAFCIVPHVRGRFDHRPLGDILAEARERVADGAREIMLVGQTVNAYRDPATGADFGDLCRAVAAISGLERLAFISPHPKDFTEKIFRDMAAVEQLNPRIHLPMQSASDRVLRRMNRKYSFAQFEEKVRWIKTYLPQWAITTDIIVGFPGETEEDFEQTRAYCATGLFAQAFMFVYSPRRGTPAAHWEQVDAAEVSARFKRLADTQNAVIRAYHDRKLGTIERCLISGPSRKDARKLATKSLNNVTVVAPMPETYDESLFAREPWLDIRIETAHVWGCTGTIVRRAGHFRDAGIPVAQPAFDLVGV